MALQGVKIDGWFRGVELKQSFLLIQKTQSTINGGITATLNIYASAQHYADGVIAISKVVLTIPYDATDPYQAIYDSILDEYEDSVMEDVPTPTPPHTPELRVEDLPIPPPGRERREINIPDRVNKITRRKGGKKPRVTV